MFKKFMAVLLVCMMLLPVMNVGICEANETVETEIFPVFTPLMLQRSMSHFYSDGSEDIRARLTVLMLMDCVSGGVQVGKEYLTLDMADVENPSYIALNIENLAVVIGLVNDAGTLTILNYYDQDKTVCIYSAGTVDEAKASLVAQGMYFDEDFFENNAEMLAAGVANQ